MDKEFWKIIGIGFGFIVVIVSFTFFIVGDLLKDVTIESLANEAGKMSATIEREYNAGKEIKKQE